MRERATGRSQPNRGINPGKSLRWAAAEAVKKESLNSVVSTQQHSRRLMEEPTAVPDPALLTCTGANAPAPYHPVHRRSLQSTIK